MKPVSEATGLENRLRRSRMRLRRVCGAHGVRADAATMRPEMSGQSGIRVAVAGFGRFASDVTRGLAALDGIEIVGISRRQGDDETIRVGETLVARYRDVGTMIRACRPDVLLEATLPEFAMAHSLAALTSGVRPVVATSGVSDSDLLELGRVCIDHSLGGVVAPNLSVGAVILMHLSAIAGRFFEHADIIEYHRDRKADAPSGTAVHTARLMQREREGSFTRVPSRTVTVPDVRGGEASGIGIHSIRLPGLVAHQEVIFGGTGQTLTLRHDAMSNDSYVPGAALAIRHAMETTGLTVGLGTLLGLEL